MPIENSGIMVLKIRVMLLTYSWKKVHVGALLIFHPNTKRVLWESTYRKIELILPHFRISQGIWIFASHVIILIDFQC